MENLFIAIAFLIGAGVGFFIKTYLDRISVKEKLEFIGNQKEMKMSDRPIELADAQTRIKELQKIITTTPNTVGNLLSTKRWVVESSTLNKIISQKNTDDNDCKYVVFYPALTEDKTGITFVLLGSAIDASGKYSLIKEQNEKQSDGTTKIMPGEIWDYIGPCPPYRNCPEDDL